MEQVFENSSNVAKIAFDGGKLTVTFKNGGVYTYDEVPQEVYDEFCTAISPGKFFAANIRSKYQGRKANADEQTQSPEGAQAQG